MVSSSRENLLGCLRGLYNLETSEKIIQELENVKQEVFKDGQDHKLVKLYEKTAKRHGLLPEIQLSDKKIIFRSDYKPLSFFIVKAHIRFDLGSEKVRVASRLFVKRSDDNPVLTLTGENLTLESVECNGKSVDFTSYPNKLKIKAPPKKKFIIDIKCEFDLKDEKRGIFRSQNNLISYNETFGFRRITYFIDRSDNLCLFTTTLIANKEKFPVLLANGEVAKQIDFLDGRHLVKYKLSNPIPSYLFAIAAGHFEKIVEYFGKVKIEAYTPHGKSEMAKPIIETLKKAMAWDDEVYGFAYSYETLKLVFQNGLSGAMENEGLITFDADSYLFNPNIMGDHLRSIIDEAAAHEYFHHLTGNRITISGPFYDFLKEGLTTFRQQEFHESLGNPSARIKQAIEFWETVDQENVPLIKDSKPFLEEHFSVTAYKKGAEIFRMLKLIVGKECFIGALQSLIGKSISLDDFMRELKVDLKQFMLWFTETGHPTVDITLDYDEEKKEARLTLKQGEKPFLIPLTFGFLNSQGVEILPSQTVILTDSEETFIIPNISERPIPSILRNFSAPIQLKSDVSNDDFRTLAIHDPDPYTAFAAAIEYFSEFPNDTDTADIILSSDSRDIEFKTQILNYVLPSKNVLLSLLSKATPLKIAAIRHIKDLEVLSKLYLQAQNNEEKIIILSSMQGSELTIKFLKEFLKNPQLEEFWFYNAIDLLARANISVHEIVQLTKHPLYDNKKRMHVCFLLSFAKFNPNFRSAEGLKFVEGEIERLKTIHPDLADKLSLAMSVEPEIE
jgi:aminopeptidase N